MIGEVMRVKDREVSRAGYGLGWTMWAGLESANNGYVVDQRNI